MRAGTVQPGEEKTEDRQAFLSDAQRQDKRQWTQTGTQEVPSDHEEAFACCLVDGALAKVAHGGGGLSALVVFKSHQDMVLGALL